MRLPATTALSLQPADASRERLQTAARELETQFAQMMLKSMRSATLGDSMMGDNTTYRDMYDQQLSKEITKGRGLGLAPMIERQLSGNLPPSTVLPGPIPLSNASHGGPRMLGQNLPIAMPLSSTSGVSYTGLSGGGLVHSGLSLAPTHAGVSMPAMAPPATPARPPAPAIAPTTDRVSDVSAGASVSDSKSPIDCSSPEAFVRSIWPHAKETARELGVSAKALVAQAALETGWGRRLVGGDGSHNLFGIKAGGSWKGSKVDSGTHEFVNGRRMDTRAQFRAYDSVRQSFADYANLMRNDRYAGALAAGDDASRFASALQKAGYATDPSYAAKISAIANGPTLQRALGALADADGPAPDQNNQRATAVAALNTIIPRG